MGCCGNRRQQIKSGATSRAVALPTRASTSGTISLHYTGSAPMLIKGNSSGLTYYFSGSQPDQAVKNADVKSLLSTGLFSNPETA